MIANAMDGTLEESPEVDGRDNCGMISPYISSPKRIRRIIKNR